MTLLKPLLSFCGGKPRGNTPKSGMKRGEEAAVDTSDGAAEAERCPDGQTAARYLRELQGFKDRFRKIAP